MGERGMMSRILAPKAKAFASFCAADSNHLAAPGQLSLDEMVQLYRWPSINEYTQFFGVIASPVGHSLSPALFNAQFDRDDLNAVYLPLLIDGQDELERFLVACQETRWLDAVGFSVTLPHKESVYRWLGTRVDRRAQRIGAVNTLHLSNGEYCGYNTDYWGVLEALKRGGGVSADDLKSVRATVLGAGGVARAVVAALTDCGAKVTVFNRSQERAEKLAVEFDCRFEPWENRSAESPDLLVNCTRVGMWPEVDDTPFPAERLRSESLVFDTIYRPQETRLIKDAKASGCKTVGGLEMFIQQAAAQYRIWTDKQADIALLQRVVEDRLNSDETRNSAQQT